MQNWAIMLMTLGVITGFLAFARAAGPWSLPLIATFFVLLVAGFVLAGQERRDRKRI